ncbi:MAG TPA: hypothetical protein VE914_24875 [Candidatus Angelobacter sp.]|nr:hypothetical protein [Candidatus Angelobacter sp.]
MRVFKILRDPHKGKQIHVTRYVTTAEGVEIAIEHDVPTVAGKEIQWVQTVSSNGGFSVDCKMLTRVDPFGHGGAVNTVSLPAVPGICKADDLLPFYWTAADLAAGRGPGLSDGPHAPAPAKGRTWTQFVTALTEVTGKNVYHLVAIAWGYDRMADGSVRVAVIRTPSTDEMRAHGKALKRMYPDYKYT